MFERDFAQRGDVVDDAVRKVGGATDEQDCVAVDEARDVRYRGFVAGCWAGDVVDFDLEVLGGFAEGRVSCFWENPGQR